ncbi:DUF554 domain-containing protein [Caproiciproducens faecalis]|uniref:DUF554 domain-containing protein n=1 Tax=Caproiciproducens faecalis TaxID=2820301 RepID=A0ABS7DKD6_9FIRM|nr:DUF554 domain-containing protein [Caproiciproducens faecalis]MBW7571764.1 DUF554 domain-containing protein [Caproiciproducens faecalis]
MLGTIVNALAIVLGTGLGLILKSGIRSNYRETIMDGVALSVLLIGVMGAIKTNDLLLLIFSLVIGSIVGEALKIEDRLAGLGQLIESRTSSTDGSVAKAFVTASLLFCVGSMAIVGSIESGLTGNHQTLFAKSVLDGIVSIFLSSTMGFGVFFSAVAVFLYQGTITLLASSLKALMTDEMIREISSVGGVLIMAIGLNMLKIKKIKVGNMLPAILVPFLYYFIKRVVGIA